MAIRGNQFKVTGASVYPICDCCGKTNLTRAVVLRNEDGEEFNVGCICASKVFRQPYQGRKLPISVGAVIAKGKAASRTDAWRTGRGYYDEAFILGAHHEHK